MSFQIKNYISNMLPNWNFLFSSRIAMLFLGFFILIIGTATFIEEFYDTATANLLIYHSIWFEFLMLILAILFFGNSIKKRLYRIDKIPQLLFHLSFVILIIGGGITRYFGYEANMHMLENEVVDELYTKDPYLQIRTKDSTFEYLTEKPVYLSQLENNSLDLEFSIEDHTIYISLKDYRINGKELFLIHSSEEDKIDYKNRNPDKEGPNAIVLEVKVNGKSHEVIVFYDETRYTQRFKSFDFDDLHLEMRYGPKPIRLPFSMMLNEFTLSKYPGTDIPSASESNVQLIDHRNGINENHIIAKNRVLDYDGYRFFQTSYDDDENGTILTVNYDYIGTRVTYFGYFLMILGSLLTLFSKTSGFRSIDDQIKQVRKRRKSLYLSLLIVIGLGYSGFAQQTVQNPIDADHADTFGHLLVQTYDGRFSSVHSLATDVIHKISGEDNFDFPGKGKMDEMHIFLDILVDPNYWMHQNLIIVREKALRDLLGVNQKHIPFSTFFNSDKSYRLDKLVKNAFQKKASEQNSFEREVIKVTERVNIFAMLLNGTWIKFFPDQDSENNRWVSWTEDLASKPLKGNLLKYNEDLKLKEFNYSNIMRSYFVSTLKARESNDYRIPEKIVKYIDNIQRQITPGELLPSKSKVKLEVYYNKAGIFDTLKYVFGVLGFILLVLTILDNFIPVANKTIKFGIKIIIGFVVLAFIYQTFGMGLRWYLGGHAPWSNGYEVLLLVAWGGVLAGLSMIRYSKITLAATALLAFLVLMTAGHSYYDPQLTNLNPVLKSYWLIIHVAIVTVGYGFLGLSFLLGLISILIHLFKTVKNLKLSNLIILELTLTNEKLVTVGMYLTAIGTFIGCIWANESWGTYWSWNAKQVWSLIIILMYGLILHFKYIPGMKFPLAFNIGTQISFGSVLMTFIGVNYYFTKGLHSYASDDPPVFPIWAWIAIMTLLSLIILAIIKKNKYEEKSL